MSSPIFRSLIDSPQMYDAKKDEVKSKIEFYQQIIQQEGIAEDFTDAVRKRFGNEASYRAALWPSVEAEKKNI